MKTEIVSKSEAARQWGVSPTMVQKYIARGLPTLSDGRLDLSAASKWRERNVVPQKSGSFRARQVARSTAEANIPDPLTDIFAACRAESWAAGYCAARNSLRRTLPALLAESKGSDVATERIRTFALVDGLLEVWFVNPANKPDAFEPVDFSAFDNPTLASEIYWGVHDLCTAMDSAEKSDLTTSEKTKGSK